MGEIMKTKERSELKPPNLLINSCQENLSHLNTDISKMSKLKPTKLEEETYQPSLEKIPSKPVTPKENVIHVTFQRTFKVIYLGYAVLDRRYTQPMLPWLIAEIKRHGCRNEDEIFIEITEKALKAVKCETNAVVFEHKLQTVSKFAQSTLDPSCFTYMTREVISGPSAYHVFQAHEENSVLELFTAVREMSKEMSNQQNQTSLVMKTASGVALDSVINSCRQYEVLYLGRIKVSGKRAPPNFIDEAVEKFRIYELEKVRNYNNSTKRQRHGSGASITSLPPNLEVHEKPNENELKKQTRTSTKGDLTSSSISSGEKIEPRKLFDSHVNCDMNPLLQSPLSPICDTDLTHKFPAQNQSLLSHSQSMDISTASQVSKDLSCYKSSSLMPPSSLITHTQSLDAPGCADIVRDLRDNDPSVILRDRVRSCSGDIPRMKQTSLPAYNRSDGGILCDVRRPRAYTSPSSNESRQCNRTMLFLIGRMEICLIGTDKKQMLLSKTFSDIAHCSQGVRHLDHFGFTCRETTLSGADCYSGYIFRCQTEKVVDEMMQTLKQAFSQAHQNYQKIPVKSQISKVFICDSCPMHWFHRLCCDVEGLAAEDAHLIILEKLGTLPDNVKEDIIMKFQKINNKNVQEQNEVLMMLLREMAEQKQLSHSHLASSNNGKNELTVMKEKGSKLDSFREKARKSLSSSFETFLKLTNRDEGKESSIYLTHKHNSEHKLLAIKDLDTRSYREGSCDSDRFSSGQISPISSRPRSSTFTSTREVHLTGKKNSRQETPQNIRPIMNILMKVGNQSKNSSPTQIETTPKGSWRQAIFHRVQTPGRGGNHGDQQECEADGSSTLHNESQTQTKKTKEELRALWKKAIIEQILLIRMEKENRKLQVNQDAACHKRMKLNYEEVTPCIKSALVQWEEILNDPNRNDSQMDKLKLTEIVKTGVPRHKRGEIWQYLAEQHINFWTRSNNNEELNTPYDELLKQLTSHQHSILIDIGRTFPNHPFYSQTLGSGQLSLFNLLKAYSLLDKEVGYCQGLSFVAGIFLLHMPEEHAFSMMKYLMFDLGLRRQYKTDMVAFQIQMYQLSRLIHDNYRDLYDHLEKYDIAPTLYAAPWFLTLFASQFPVGFVARLFDLIFLYGMDVVFKISLVLLGNYKDYILTCDSFESTMNFLKTTLPSLDILQMEIIFTQVFNLDISRQLHAYEVEYHVLMEEMVHSPSKNSAELENLKSANKVLKAQNMELMEQLQVAYSRIHNLEASDASLKSTVARLEKRVAVLEDEKEALVHSMRVMKCRLEKLEVARIEVPENEEHAPPFAVVYAMAGSEREEDEQFQTLMRDFCQNKEKGDLSDDYGELEFENNRIQEDILEDVFEEAKKFDDE